MKGRSLLHFLEHKQDRLLSPKKSSSTFGSAPEKLTFHHGEFSLADETVNLLTVSFLVPLLPHGEAHGSDKDSADLESGVHVIKGYIGHVAGHPDTGSSHHVEMVSEMLWELVDAPPKEEVVMLAVESALFHSLQEVVGDVESLQICEATVLQGLPDDAGSTADVQGDG